MSQGAHGQHEGLPVPQVRKGILILGTLLQELCCSTLVSHVNSWSQTCMLSLPSMSTKALVMIKANLNAMGNQLGMAAGHGTRCLLANLCMSHAAG